MLTIYDDRDNISMNTSYIYLEYTACSVCKKVGEHMKADEAMLLPTLHKELVNEAFAFMFPWLGDLSEQDLPTNHWLLSQLHQAQTQGSVQAQTVWCLDVFMLTKC